jgi:hypothetical protein|tara:strand:+ start:212 stop:388 length:177 start_codon:yes stop_codon:yes gene_type:complete
MNTLLALSLSLSTVTAEALPESICHEVLEVLIEAVAQEQITVDEASDITLKCIVNEYI